MEQRIIDRSYVGEILQRIYESRLNTRLVISLPDGYFYIDQDTVKTPLRGTSVEEAVTDLAQHLTHEFPQSPFASWWTQNFANNPRGRHDSRPNEN